MQSDWDREPIFKAELTKMFLAYNRQSGETMLQAKSVLLSETLSSLPTGEIKRFFSHIRTNEDTLPTYSRMVQILRAGLEKFNVKKVSLLPVENYQFGGLEHEEIKQTAMKYPAFIPLLQELLDNDDVYPSEDWNKRFWQKMGEGVLVSDDWTDGQESNYSKYKRRVE